MEIINTGDYAVAARQNLMAKFTWVQIDLLRALRFNDGAHFSDGTPGVENIAGDGITLAPTNIRIEFNNPASQLQCFLTQIGGCVRVIFQNLHNIPDFQNRSNTATDGLTPIGDQHFQMNIELIADKFK